jgi:hypothetical protein
MLTANESEAQSPPTRQVRRNAEREAAKAADTHAKNTTKIEAELQATLSYLPDSGEVADLIDAVLSEDLFLEADAIAMREAAAAMRAGTMPAGVGYAAMLRALRLGPCIERALASLDARYEPHDVVELRALKPDGHAVSFSGRLGHERDQMAAFIHRNLGRRNIYHGINLRRIELAGTVDAADASDVIGRRHVVLDLDNKDAPVTDPNWTQLIQSLSHSSQLILDTGNGTHIWFSIDPIEGADVAPTTASVAAAMEAIGADNMADLPRIARLPFTINIPTKTKRPRGAKLSLVRIRQVFNPQARRWRLSDLTRHLQDMAQQLGLPGKQSSANGNTKKDHSTSASSLPPELRRVPALNLLTAALALLPNTDRMDRDVMVGLFHAVKGASNGTGFETEARDAALAWAGCYPGSDHDHDAQTYDGIREALYAGWSHVRGMLGEYNPAGLAQIDDMEAPFRIEAARAAFRNPDADRQLREQGIEPVRGDVANGNTTPQTSVSEHDASTAAMPSKGGKKNRAEAAIEYLINVLHAEFFNSPDGKLWVRVLGHIYQVSEKGSNRAIVSVLVKRGHSVIGNAQSELRDHMVARAMAGSTHEVSYRQTQIMDNGSPVEAVLNLMDPDGSGVRITSATWSVEPLSAIDRVRMTARSGSLPLPRPVRAGDGVRFFERLRRHTPLATVQKLDDARDVGVQHEATVLMFLMAQLIRTGAVPHLVLSAEQGSGKTTFARRLKSLVDPDKADVVPTLPDNDADLFAIVGTQTVVVVDNASSLKAPDQFAALSTGAAIAKRALYTDDERAIFNARTSIIFTTVLDNITKRPDVRDRMLRIETPRIDPKKRKTEAELDAAWAAERPHLLADLLDIASRALARLPAVKAASDAGLLPPLPRLADAALVAEAAAQVAGWKPGLLLEAINEMRSSDAARQLEDDPYAVRVRTLLEQAPGRTWTGTAQDLVVALQVLGGPELPRYASMSAALMSMAERIERPLRETWNIETVKQRTKHRRIITLRML